MLEQRSHTYSELEALVLDCVSDIQISNEEANSATIAAIKLHAKIAERDDLKRRIAEGLAKWETRTSGVIKNILFASAERNGRALSNVEAEIVDLDQVVRSTRRSVMDDRRDMVGRMRNEMIGLDGEALFDARARLSSALRQVIDHLEFQGDGIVRVILIGGLKLYHFALGRLIATFDLADETQATMSF